MDRQYARGVGGILADDMGLGKTIQAIAFIAALLLSPEGVKQTSQVPPPRELLTAWRCRQFGSCQGLHSPTCIPILVAASHCTAQRFGIR